MIIEIQQEKNGKDSKYFEKTEAIITSGSGYFSENGPPMDVIVIEIEGKVYRFRTQDLRKMIKTFD